MKKYLLLILFLFFSPTLPAQSTTEVLINGKNLWPPQGAHCEKFMRCYDKAKLQDNSVDVFCKMLPAQKDFACDKGIYQISNYLRGLKKETPMECVEVKVQ